MRQTLRTYYLLTKPGIIYGNAINAAAGFFLASKFHSTPLLFLSMLLGLSCIIGSACVFNNVLDRGIDEKMERTKKRAMVTKAISIPTAIVFGIILILAGTSLLLLETNLLTTFVALIGFFVYVALYTPSKKRTIYSTLIGSISGAVPPVVGYTAVTNRFDVGALLLFIILVAWQMPHFYAIAIYRLKDYANAGVPVLSVKKGVATTKIQILLYTVLFVVATILLTVFKYTGYIYLAVTLLVGLFWLYMGIQGFWTKDSEKWAKKMFFFSLIVTIVFAVIVSVGGILP